MCQLCDSIFNFFEINRIGVSAAVVLKPSFIEQKVKLDSLQGESVRRRQKDKRRNRRTEGREGRESREGREGEG